MTGLRSVPMSPRAYARERDSATPRTTPARASDPHETCHAVRRGRAHHPPLAHEEMQVRERLAERKHPVETAQHAPEHHRYRLVSAARLAAMVLDAGELLEVMVAEVGDALVQRAKRAAVRWEHQRRGVAGVEPRARIEERAQRIRVGGGWKYADAGRDRSEHLVAAGE